MLEVQVTRALLLGAGGTFLGQPAGSQLGSQQAGSRSHKGHSNFYNGDEMTILFVMTKCVSNQGCSLAFREGAF